MFTVFFKVIDFLTFSLMFLVFQAPCIALYVYIFSWLNREYIILAAFAGPFVFFGMTFWWAKCAGKKLQASREVIYSKRFVRQLTNSEILAVYGLQYHELYFGQRAYARELEAAKDAKTLSDTPLQLRTQAVAQDLLAREELRREQGAEDMRRLRNSRADAAKRSVARQEVEDQRIREECSLRLQMDAAYGEMNHGW